MGVRRPGTIPVYAHPQPLTHAEALVHVPKGLRALTTSGVARLKLVLLNENARIKPGDPMLKLFRRNRHPVALAPTPTSGSSLEQETVVALHQHRLDALTMPTVTDAIGSYLYYRPQDAHSLQARRHILQAVHAVVNSACSWIKVNPGTGGLLINLHHSAPRKSVAPSQLDAYLRGIARHAPSYEKYPVVHIADLSNHAHTLTINHDRDGYMLDSSTHTHLATPVPVATIEEAISLIRQEKKL